MLRAFFVNKWTIAGIAFLMLFAGACYFWYQHTTAQYERDVVNIAEFTRHSNNSQKPNSSKTGQAPDTTSVENTNQHADEQINVAPENAEIRNTEIVTPSIDHHDHTHHTEHTDIYVSAHGFGPFPQIPADYPRGVIWSNRSNYESLPAEHRINLELLQRVMVKAWSDGDKGFHGGRLTNGKVLLMRPNTVYVKYSEYTKPDGTVHRYISQGKGNQETTALLKSHPDYPFLTPQMLPDNIKVENIESIGIDPYQYLGLNK